MHYASNLVKANRLSLGSVKGFKTWWEKENRQFSVVSPISLNNYKRYSQHVLI